MYYEKEKVMMLATDRKMNRELAMYHLTDSGMYCEEEEEIAAQKTHRDWLLRRNGAISFCTLDHRISNFPSQKQRRKLRHWV